MERSQLNNVPGGVRYTEMCRRIIHDIRKGVYPPGSRLPSKTALMRLFGVSDGPAKRAMLELVREGLAYAVPGRGWYVTEQTDAPAAVPVRVRGTASAKHLLFITCSVLHEFNAPILRGILDVAQSRGYRVEVIDTGGSYRKECAALTRCFAHQPAGVILNPMHSDCAFPQLVQLQRRRIPVVLLNDRVTGQNLPFVGVADFKGTRTATNHLIALGHRRIAFIGIQYPERYSSLSERFAGYLRALKSAGIRYDPSLALFGDRRVLRNRGLRTSGHYEYRILKEFLRPPLRFTAAVAYNDSAALAACYALEEYGLRVPDDVSIIGFDHLRESQMRRVPLSTIAFDARRLGAAAARMVIELGGGAPVHGIPERHIPVKLIVGGTTKRLTSEGGLCS